MALVDLPLAELEQYRPDPPAPAGHADFWARTLGETRAHPLDVERAVHPLDLPLVEVHEVSFAGFAGDRIHALHLRPRGAGQVPTVVQFLGYGDGTGSPLDWLGWPCAGFATLVMDTRGQGARARRAGRTGDPHGSAGPHVEGFLTRGVLDPEDTYYRRVYSDAVRAVDTALALPGGDSDRVAVHGASQGGALALAAAALHDDVAAALIDVPFLCHIRRAVTVTDHPPYTELRAFLGTHRQDAERALRTLDHVDGLALAGLARARALFSVALMDEVCPPSTVYAAYHAYGGPKDLAVYPYNGHEGGGVQHAERQVAWLHEALRTG